MDAKEARRAYYREYYKKNREKILEKNRRYWERLAKKLEAERKDEK
jgi:hypothetical protein